MIYIIVWSLLTDITYVKVLRLPDRSPGPKNSLTKEESMEISIEYCGICNYRPIAAVLAMAIEKETGIKPLLVHSKEQGVLEVKVGSDLIFSKKQTGRFPDRVEVLALLKKKSEPVEAMSLKERLLKALKREEVNFERALQVTREGLHLSGRSHPIHSMQAAGKRFWPRPKRR